MERLGGRETLPSAPNRMGNNQDVQKRLFCLIKTAKGKLRVVHNKLLFYWNCGNPDGYSMSQQESLPAPVLTLTAAII